MRNPELLRDDLLVLGMRHRALAILSTRHAREKVSKVCVKFTKHGHVLRHLTERVHFPSQAAPPSQLAGIL